LQKFNKIVSKAGCCYELLTFSPRTKLVDTTSFFTMLHTFMRGWDESEFPRILHCLNRKFNISELVKKVSFVMPGFNPLA